MRTIAAIAVALCGFSHADVESVWELSVTYDRMTNSTTTLALAESAPTGARFYVECDADRLSVTVAFVQPLLVFVRRSGKTETPYLFDHVDGTVERGAWYWDYGSRGGFAFLMTGDRRATELAAIARSGKVAKVTMRAGVTDYTWSLAGLRERIDKVVAACGAAP